MVSPPGYLVHRFGLKRILDWVVAGALIVLCLPLLLVTAMLIRLTSPGPVLFRQPRLGQNQREFICLKFRSMRPDADPGKHRRFIAECCETNPASRPGLHKLHGDDRVTPVGRIIRCLSIDELPQLINVLRGEMSLVGPRPALAYELEHYSADMFGRFAVRPGLTGLWQVSGRAALSFPEMLKKDLEYVRRGNFWLDVRILCQTPAAVLDFRRTR